MTNDLAVLAAQLDDVVRAVPGVATVFAADPALVRTAKQLASRSAPLPLVQVTGSDEALTVVVSVGLRAEEQAPLTGAAVAAAVRAALPEGSEADVRIRISRVS